MFELIILFICVFGTFIVYKKYKKNNLLKDPTYKNLLNTAKNFLNEIDSYRKLYFTNTMKEKLKNDYQEAVTLLSSKQIGRAHV